jgi:PAS domain S-box-containing protein
MVRIREPSFHAYAGFGLKLLSVSVAYAALARIAMDWFSIDGMFGVFWPASGFALAVLLTGGRRYAWAVVLGTLLANALAGRADWATGIFAIDNALEALIAHALLNRQRQFVVSDWSLRSYLRLTLYAGVPAVSVSSGLGVLALLSLGRFGTGQLWPSLLHWWMGNLLGIVLVTPLVLLWRRWPRLNPWPQRLPEATLVLGVSLLIGQVVFLGWLPDSLGLVARQGYWMFFFVTWAAIRLGSHGVVLLLCGVAVQALLGAHTGVGFFANDLINDRFTNLWFYMICLSLVGMALSAYLAELQRSTDSLRVAAIAFECQEGIVIMDADGTVLRVNRAFTGITGYSQEEAQGQTIAMLRSDRHTAAFYEAVRDEARRCGTWQGEMWHRRKNGEDYPERVTFTAVRDDQGQVTHFVGTFTDVTTARQQEQQRLHNESLHRDALVREVHHRIKNNLQGIIGVLRQCAQNYPQTAEPIQQTIGQVQGISVIHGLLGHSNPSSVQLCELTQAIATEVSTLWQTPIAVDLPQPWAACTLAESEAVPMALVLNELMHNAVKHGGKAHGDTCVTLRKAEQPDHVLITVANTGQLPSQDRRAQHSQAGLRLIKSLLPHTGTQFDLQQIGHQVVTTLLVTPPVIRLQRTPSA